MLPIAPSVLRDLIPKPGGNFCEKFLKSLNLPSEIHKIIAYMWNEDGSFTDDFKADLCNLSCNCGEGGVIVPGALRAPTVAASDGSHADRVQITWNAPAGALQYDLYRSQTNVAGGTLLAADLQTTSFEDTTVTPNQFYYYSVKSKNQFGASGYSNVDKGHAGTIATTLPMVTDLVAAQGIRLQDPTQIALVFTPAAGAESYDFYRNVVDDFATATLIDSNRVPTDNTNSFSLGAAPYFVDNVGELEYFHDPGLPVINYYTKYYFWVKAKRSSPPADSPPSNSGAGALGWACGRGDGTIPSPISGAYIADGGTGTAVPYTVPASVIEVWLVGLGSGAGGAGGGPTHGGGGGGAGPVMTGKFPVVTGAKFRMTSTPSGIGTTKAASEVNGDNGSQSKLQYSANGLFTDTIDLMTSNAPAGGVYNAGGAGAGGAGSTGTKHASVTEGQIYAGRAGRPGTTPKGGRNGWRIGEVRKPAVSDGSQGAPAGTGGSAHASVPSARVAGRGVNGIAYIIPYVT